MALRVVLIVLAALLLGAHFLREGNYLLVAVCVSTPLLFLWRKRASIIALQLLAYAAAATWIYVAFRLVEARQQTGRSWTAAVLILGSVALFTLVAGQLLNSPAITQRYRA